MQEEASQLRSSLRELRGTTTGDWMGAALDEDDMYNHELAHDCALLARRLRGETGDGDWMGAPRDSSVEDYEPDLLSGSSGCDVALFKAMIVLKRHLR